MCLCVFLCGCLQVLVLVAEPGDLAAQFHAIHSQSVIPLVPLHHRVRLAGHAALRWRVSTALRYKTRERGGGGRKKDSS